MSEPKEDKNALWLPPIPPNTVRYEIKPGELGGYAGFMLNFEPNATHMIQAPAGLDVTKELSLMFMGRSMYKMTKTRHEHVDQE